MAIIHIISHCRLPLFLAEQFEMMQTASLTVDRDMTVCQCEYRKEGGET